MSHIMSMKFFMFLASLGAMSFILVYHTGPTSVMSLSGPHTPLIKVNKSKWIVVTSIQYPTRDIKELASLAEWTVVVVADRKTPPDWNHPNVHFLTIEQQRSFGHFAKLLPYNTYARKNIGYLYAITNGAEWIYDTDDDNKPYHKGLQQFDYTATVSGLRFISKNSNISENLFNPYQFYGYSDMWPRGFPLEYLKEHRNGKDKLLVCRKMKTAAVQQGIVHNDPDVDAVYRLLHADKATGLHVKFNQIAPPITLGQDTYAPWNSQNTLFHHRAFFTLFLPTTVAFRVTDIWRSYFAQKLLHLIGEQIAFYPVNAMQIRNAHDYLKDFDQEIDVYEKSGKIVEFIANWTCGMATIDECTIELAKDFLEQNFWKKDDYVLVKAWIQILREVNYSFPAIINQTENWYGILGKWSNCREANLDMGINTQSNDRRSENIVAEKAISSYHELINWCEKSTDANGTNFSAPSLPLAEEFGPLLANGTLKDRQDSVLVLINNYPWKASIGLLQRIYEPFFGVTIFCGTWDPSSFVDEVLPPQEPINFINISVEEMQKGWAYNYCVSKVRDLRLQNVKGYFFVADDTLFNFWYHIPMDKVNQPVSIDYHSRMFWSEDYGIKFLNLVEGKYANDSNIQRSWEEYQTRLIAKGSNLTAAQHIMNFTGKACSDFMYIPTAYMEYFSDLTEVFVESGMMVENAMPKLFHTVDYARGEGFFSLWTNDRGKSFKEYRESLLGVHPIKLSFMDRNTMQRREFCNNAISRFMREIFQ